MSNPPDSGILVDGEGSKLYKAILIRSMRSLSHSLLTPLILLILFQIGRDSNRLLWSQINCLAFSLIDLPSLLFS